MPVTEFFVLLIAYMQNMFSVHIVCTVPNIPVACHSVSGRFMQYSDFTH